MVLFSIRYVVLKKSAEARIPSVTRANRHDGIMCVTTVDAGLKAGRLMSRVVTNLW